MNKSYTNDPIDNIGRRAPNQSWRYEVERFLESEWHALKIECESDYRAKNVHSALCFCIKRNGLPARAMKRGTLIYVVRKDTEEADGRV